MLSGRLLAGCLLGAYRVLPGCLLLISISFFTFFVALFGPPCHCMFKWVTETIKDMWNNVRHEHIHIPQAFDKDNTQQHDAVRESISSSAPEPSYLFK